MTMTKSKFFDLFPTTIYIEYLDKDIVNQLDDLIIPKLSNLEDRGDYFTDYYTKRIVNEKEITPFLNLFYKKAQKYCNRTHVAIKDEVFYWVQDYKKDHKHEKHTHPGSTISGIYYIRANEHAGKLRMETPNPYTIFTSYTHINHAPLSCDITPEKGMLILFPSWLSHEVIPSPNEGCIRTCIAFNID